MNSDGLSDSLSGASKSPVKCQKCGATTRLETGVCASCLLREGLGTLGGISGAAYEAVLAFAYLVDRENVRMIKAGCRVGFASKPHERFM